ncbi:hypothetical protein O7606_04255 [Micromonospora sp. WMMD882]|uniref:hypothetical protein n=1 Tax=Micromonospora sp. WMMD882 TaxID=3015151 RepID=UPI00248C47A9|nr:hypothetical protein [Micromonospora sp. WMMD882]WBB80610.1 hypothetical protein O7606_04255 [Micromonospora sp. WMMD882]
MPGTQILIDDRSTSTVASAADLVRELARRGVLADRMRDTSDAERQRLHGGAYQIVWPVVFQRLTRRVELARGHRSCARALDRLEPECLDRFQDDVEAVLDDLSRNARTPIVNLEGWVGSRLTAATVDGHRRRRGERGALQRPRLPGWLVTALDGDPWLTVLATEVLVWVGVPTTAGVGTWPLTAWAERRAAVTGRLTHGEAEVARDVDRVLAAMRRRGPWYADFVERPLGRKQAPVLPALRAEADQTHDWPPLALVPRHEVDDARLRDLATTAVAAIEARVRRREDLRDVVVDVLGAVFGAGTGADDLDRTPGAGPADEERVVALLADPATVDRIVAVLLDLRPGPTSPRDNPPDGPRADRCRPLAAGCPSVARETARRARRRADETEQRRRGDRAGR